MVEEGGKNVRELLRVLFTDLQRSPVAYRPATVVFRYLRRELGNRDIPLAVVRDYERRYVRQNQINKNVSSRRFPRLPYIVYGGSDQIWQLDLIDLHGESGRFRYGLTKVDVFNRAADVELLTSKSAAPVLQAFKKIVERNKGFPEKVQTDEGKEFFNRVFKAYCDDNDISLYAVNSEVKAALVERFNRTFQELYYRYKNSLGPKARAKSKEIAALVVRNYNHSPHTSLFGLAPVDVTPEKEASILALRLRSVARIAAKRRAFADYKFREGHKVRILSERKAFSKGFRGTYTEEVFVIRKRFRRKIRPDINLYLLKDLTGENIDGTFYEQELQRVEVDTGNPVVKTVLKRDRKNKRKLVSLVDFPVKHSRWIKD